jgi:hypothetical protein
MPSFNCNGPTCGGKYQQGISDKELKKHPFNSATFLSARTEEDLEEKLDNCGWADHPSYGKICAKCSKYLRRDVK